MLPTLTWPHVWLLIASLLAGALNAMAGGGSFLSFPAVLGTGMLPIQANATNTVALWPGQFASIAAYWDDLKHNLRLLAPLGAAALLGGLAGGLVLLRTGQATFLRLVPWLLLVAALLFAVSTPVSRWLQRRAAARETARLVSGSTLPAGRVSMTPLFLGMVLVCFYIGYFGAGAGFLVMSLLAIFGVEEINQINALKVVTTCLANGIAVVTFVIEKQVLWQTCLLMMVTAAIGGYFGGRWARRVDARVMRGVVVAIGLGMAGYFFWRGV
ncbi:membrane protein, putative [Acidisarcina polymorpha]|uniref:Probable membrane transporter protein n=1 Tax=Acidisarcina polymorpha TaxID=2211140 RepID=A0A2Z5FYQ4_9BACT|nr:sulfite exporter TauE/SafE family protein [Acidisarcina polymorpha]AXC11597.1 membrane protein, putative [Acidisarcina polymorpha]